MDKARINIGSVTMPAGTYWVGDPCYAVADDDWQDWLESADYRNSGRYLLAELHGQPVLGISTAMGDGTYEDEQGNQYPVDAGMIGVTHVGAAGDKPWLEGLRRVTFEVDFECRYEALQGTIVLGLIKIPTDPEGLSALFNR